METSTEGRMAMRMECTALLWILLQEAGGTLASPRSWVGGGAPLLSLFKPRRHLVRPSLPRAHATSHLNSTLAVLVLLS